MLIAPVLLGDGTPLFRRPGGVLAALERVHVSTAAGVINLWFRVGSLSAYPAPDPAPGGP